MEASPEKRKRGSSLEPWCFRSVAPVFTVQSDGACNGTQFGGGPFSLSAVIKAGTSTSGQIRHVPSSSVDGGSCRRCCCQIHQSDPTPGPF